ncbi:hypothetical protein Tsubulata_045420 [Turnera subulata]|uniref:Uncharacterized protein n=1 Tax=Turnera subulata TaxID=218843 RepID=A0A9Q0GBV1_9ROSI|nr:hypothetical protein Tsubulata_045420 [Turnera subulata]
MKRRKRRKIGGRLGFASQFGDDCLADQIMAAPEVCRKRKQPFQDSLTDVEDDDDEDLSGTEEDERLDYRRAIDGVADDGLVPLNDNVAPDIYTKYVPKKVRRVFDLYTESVTRSQGFDCDGYYYWKLPYHIRKGRLHPIDVSDPGHSPKLETCAQFAITSYNAEKETMPPLRLEGIEKANACVYNDDDLYHLFYYIIMKVKDESTVPAESKTCRAKVYYKGSPRSACVCDPEPKSCTAGDASLV